MLLAVTAVFLFASNGARAGRTLIRIPAKGPIVFEQLRRPGIEILAVDKHGIIDAMVDDKQVDYVRSLGYPISVVPAAMLAPGAAAELDANLGMYHTFAEMESLITTWEGDYPGICDVSTIGYSVENRPIYAIKISDDVSVADPGEPDVLYMGNHHARELMSVEIPLRFAQYLLVNYAGDPTVASYVDTREIYFVPMINPDGHVYVQNHHIGIYSGSWWRKNRRVNADMSVGVDLNRNYGYQWGYDDVGSSPTMSYPTYRGASAFSEPETQAVGDFVSAHDFTMWLSYHSYGELLLYPWNYIATNTADQRYYERLGELLTENNDYLSANFAMGALYAVNGSSDDWGYGEQAAKEKIFAFTPEVNSYEQGGFGPSDTLIAPTFDLLLDMNMKVLEYCANPYGVVGPYRPIMYPIDAPYHPIHTLNWSGAVPGDLNPPQYYQVERCTNPGYTFDDAEVPNQSWVLHGFTRSADAHSGSWGYDSGSGNNKFHTITAARPFVVDAQSDTFTFWANYQIEPDWDYAYVEVSANLGQSWTTVEGNITTTLDPYQKNRGNGITGSSPGWVEGIFPLTAYLGLEIRLRISYVTDSGVVEPGIDIDDLWPVPACQTVDLIAPAETDTTLLVIPDQVGTFVYRVRALDAQDDASGWSNTRTTVVTSVTDATTPLTYRSRLGQNHPNPFNPTTRIPYVVGGESPRPVTLRIYDVAGRLVATLVDEIESPGGYEATWNGAGDGGEPVASGIYFYRLTVGADGAFTRKMLLLK
jgi:hypothetical protein